MRTIKVYTLFDITETGIVRTFNPARLPTKDKSGVVITNETEWRYSRRRQSNLEVVLQLLSLRTQPLNIKLGVLNNQPPAKHNFGSIYNQKQTIWTLEFEIEHEHALMTKDGPDGALCHDFNNVPMLVNLNETSRINNYFTCTGPETNVYFAL